MAAPPLQSPDLKPSYFYRCNDRSWLTGVISARIAPRIEPWLPSAWSANTVTGAGSLLMWALLAGVALCPSPQRERLAPLWVALLWGYCLLDHVDGCRARRRRSSSAWGEFLDHALDAWHGGIAVYVVGAMGGPAAHPGIMVMTIASVALATVATWLEQKLRGEFSLGAIGPVEAVVAAGLYLSLWSWPAARGLGAPLSAHLGLTWADLALLLGAAGNLFTVASAAWRSPAIAGPLSVEAVAAGVIVGLGFVSGLAWTFSGVAVVILTAEYSARVITSHLTRSAMPWPDLVGPALLLCAAVFLAESPRAAMVGLFWLAGRALVSWRAARQKLAAIPAAWPAGLALEVE